MEGFNRWVFALELLNISVENTQEMGLIMFLKGSSNPNRPGDSGE